MIEEYGQTGAGQPVQRIAISDGALSAGVLTLGAILQDLRLSGRPVTLGAQRLAAYDNGPMRYFGAVIGPVAGRIAGARGTIGDRSVQMEANEGPNALHSGSAGLHRQIWQVETHDAASVALRCVAAPGDGGLPGARVFRAVYALADGALRLTLEAETDAPTWINLTQHSYWHLGGPPGVDGHRLRIWAERYLPIDAATLPTGEITPVPDTAFDFRGGRALGPGDRLDHCFCVADAARALSTVAQVTGPDGTTLTLSTEAPGLQVHTGDGVSVPAELGLDGLGAPMRPGLALEPQDWPDAPSHPGFPSILLQPGTVWRRVSVFALSGGPD
ncbi:MAG: aldose epimerase family protein [Pseudomonadota bacterium]